VSLSSPATHFISKCLGPGAKTRETGGGRAARSLIITDPKGEAWDLTSAHLAQTHDVLRLDFTTPDGAGYNWTRWPLLRPG